MVLLGCGIGDEVPIGVWIDTGDFSGLQGQGAIEETWIRRWRLELIDDYHSFVSNLQCVRDTRPRIDTYVS
jgi:hypothetical protein